MIGRKEGKKGRMKEMGRGESPSLQKKATKCRMNDGIKKSLFSEYIVITDSGHNHQWGAKTNSASLKSYRIFTWSRYKEKLATYSGEL